MYWEKWVLLIMGSPNSNRIYRMGPVTHVTGTADGGWTPPPLEDFSKNGSLGCCAPSHPIF
jgi:hypothetical protein